MIVRQIKVNSQTENFSYVVGCEATGEGFVVDPAFSPDRIMREIDETGLSIRYIINTHGHPDHVNANEEIKDQTGADILMPEGEIGPDPDRTLTDFETVEVGNLEVQVIFTPGHTVRSSSLIIRAERIVFTGDTLFVGKVGGTDSSGKTARMQYEALHNRLAHLPENTVVYPGHDYGPKSESTIGWEKQNNPFLLQSSFIEFCDLKANWSSRKQKWEKHLEENA